MIGNPSDVLGGAGQRTIAPRTGEALGLHSLYPSQYCRCTRCGSPPPCPPHCPLLTDTLLTETLLTVPLLTVPLLAAGVYISWKAVTKWLGIEQGLLGNLERFFFYD